MEENVEILFLLPWDILSMIFFKSVVRTLSEKKKKKKKKKKTREREKERKEEKNT